MTLKQDLKWSPGDTCVGVIRTGEYDDGALLARVQEIALQTGLAERGISTESSKATKKKKATTSKEG